jgi:hypothetical protein
MLDRIVPVEEKLFYREFEEKIESKRAHLRKLQNDDMIRLEERLKKLKWDETRRTEKDVNM